MNTNFFRPERAIPEIYRSEFRHELLMMNVARTIIISRFTLVIYAVLCIVVDIYNALNLTEQQRWNSFTMHCVMSGIILCYLLVVKIFQQQYPHTPYTLFRRLTISFGSIMLVMGDMMMYMIAGVTPMNIIAIYISYILIWGMTMMLRPFVMVMSLSLNIPLILGLFSHCGIKIGIEHAMIVCLSTTAIIVFSRLMFIGYQTNFLSRKNLEQERNRIATLNGEIATAYEEAEALNKHLTETLHELDNEKRKSEALLLNVLPVPIAERLKSGETLIADIHEEATILFADIVGFTKLSAQNSAVEIVQMLNTIFSDFDELSERYDLEKIKTIGDVGGIPHHRQDHAEAVALMALDVLRGVQHFSAQTNATIHVRIGIHTGTVVAGVIGTKKFVYDLWGDTVNTASRMESHGEAGKIHCTDEVYQRLHTKFLFEQRDAIEIKGKGMMKTWFLVGCIADEA
jgi:class 3 adenylate cyclase